MSTTPPTDPNDPKNAAKKEMNNAVLWAVLAAAFALGMFWYSGKVAPEKKNFYLLGAGIGAIIAVVNGYSAWTLSQKAKQPPK
jgi:high-affinity Fe2+/Pb2+ permease